MKLKELLFTGMDIVKEAKHLLGRTVLSKNMTDEELKAYKIGVNNTLRAIKVILDSDEHVVVNVKNQSIPTEIDLDELIEICEEKEKINYD